MFRSIIYMLMLLPFFIKLHASSWYLGIDNDFFFESDDKYTAGLHLNWRSDNYRLDKKSFDNDYTSFLSDLISLIRRDKFKDKKRNAGLGLNELIITPDDLAPAEPIYDDAPYIGILNLTSSLFVWDATTLEEYRTTIGIVGPSSGATELQTRVHKIIGAQNPKGWHNQLSDYAFVQLDYLKGFKNFEHRFSNNTYIQWFHNYVLSMGNLYIGAGGGTYIRWGRNIPDNFVVISDNLNSSPNHQINLESRSKALGWATRLGLFTHAPAYSYIDEESERRGYNYDRSHSQIIAQIGLDLFVKNFQLSVELYPSGSLYKSYREDSWGRIHFTWYQ